MAARLRAVLRAPVREENKDLLGIEKSLWDGFLNIPQITEGKITPKEENFWKS